VTTVALFHSDLSPDFLCFAHSIGVRVVWGASFPASQLSNQTAREEWVNQWLQIVKSTYTDGVNVDFEQEIASNSSNREHLVQLVQELRTAFDAEIPGN
jgi:di-N-acetylchitobiase